MTLFPFAAMAGLASANSTVPAVPGGWLLAAVPAAVPGAAPAPPIPVGVSALVMRKGPARRRLGCADQVLLASVT